PDGNYLIVETQPPSVFQAGQAGFYDGIDTVGTAGGSSPANNQLAGQFTSGGDRQENNFGENPPADPLGVGYVAPNDHRIPEPGVGGVAVTVWGAAFAGTPREHPLTAADVPGGQLTVLTDGGGRWDFPIRPRGTYSFVETHPMGFIDGREENADPNPPFTVI